MHDLLARDRREFALAVIVVAGELTLGVLQGIALGVALSLLMLTHRTGHPQGGVLGQLPGTEAYRDVRHHPAERSPSPDCRFGAPAATCIEAIVGSSNFYECVTDGVLAWQEQERLTATAAGPPR